MKKSLTESLTQFLSSENTFDNPYDDSPSDSISANEFIKKQKESSKGTKKKKKKNEIEALIERVESIAGKDESDDDDDDLGDFDTYLENFMLEDEDDDLRNDLIRRGRLYTRSTATSKESSELQKMYAGSEQRLEKLIKEIEDDNSVLQEDITRLRMSRSRNYKALSELVSTRRAYHETVLGAIKEINAMTKAKVELQLKVDKEHKEENGDQDLIANRAIQNLFSMGRDSLIGSYADVSGSSEAGTVNAYAEEIDEDSIIQKKYFSDDEDETDEDKFLKYEGMGVEYVLEIDEDGNPIQIISEDRDGNIIPDYPVPELTDDLSFNVSRQTHSATDNLARKYKLHVV